MPEFVEAIVQATGGWTYHIRLTKEIADQIIHARIGDVVPMTRPDETLTIFNSRVIQHFQKTKDGSKCEELDSASVFLRIQSLFSDDAWEENEDEA